MATPRPGRELAASVRPAAARRRHRGRGRGHGDDRAEGSRLRRASPECRSRTASTRRRPARSSTRSSARRGRSRPVRAPRSPRWPAERVLVTGLGGTAGGGTRRRRSPSSPGSCSCCSPCCGWVGSPSSSPRRWSPGFLAGAAVDVVDRRAAEADRDLGRRGHRLAGARLLGRRRSARSIGRRCSSAPSSLARDPRRCASCARRFPARWCWSSAGCSPPACSTSARTGSRWSDPCRAACRHPQLPDLDVVTRPPRDDRRSPSVALLLIGFSQTAGDAQGVRRPASLPHRRQPGVGRARDGERRRRGVPGDAGVDQPVGELAERVGRAPGRRSPRWSPARSCWRR